MHTITNNVLLNLVAEVEEKHKRQKDIIVNTRDLQFQTTDQKSEVILEAKDGLPTQVMQVNDYALGQIGTKAGIATKTIHRFKESYPDVLDLMINRIWQSEPNNQMLRAYDRGGEGNLLRGFVSDSFKTFDNYDLLQAVLPPLAESQAQFEVMNGSITDRRMYFRLKSKVIKGEPALNDVMALGIAISNSEVGAGSVSVGQLFWTLACLNGMQTENRTRSTHVTSSRGENDTWSLLTQEARDADNQALSLKVRDLTLAYSSRESFDKGIEAMRQAHTERVTGTSQAVIEQTCKVLELPKQSTESLLDCLIETKSQSGYQGPTTKATVINAVTNYATHRNDDLDKTDDLQKLGGKLLKMPANVWQSIATAGAEAIPA